MIEVDVQVVGPQAAQAALERRHYFLLRVARAHLGLGAEDHPVTHAAQALAHGLLRPAEAVALGRVEEGDAAIQGVAHQIGIMGAGRAEADVRDLEPGATEGDMASDPGRRIRSRRFEGRQARTESCGGPQAEQAAAVDHDGSCSAVPASRHPDMAQGMRVSPANGIVQSPATGELPQELQHEHALDA